MNRDNQRIRWPDGKAFAFAIIDDTDQSTVANVKPVYDLLYRLKIPATKTVWVLPPEQTTCLDGATLLGDPEYLQFVRDLRDRGFEIAFHNATSHGVQREKILYAMEKFHDLIGYYPRVHANHCDNRDNVYWDTSERLYSFLPRLVYKLTTASKHRLFEGAKEGSPYFWGDLCQKHIQYIRNLSFQGINQLRYNPTVPYRQSDRPYAKYWFSSVEGPDVTSCCHVLRDENLDRLEREGGLCILYVHFASGFAENGQVSEPFRRRMESLAARNGYFATVSAVLDYLLAQGGGGEIPPRERRGMEWAWLREKLVLGLRSAVRRVCGRRRGIA